MPAYGKAATAALAVRDGLEGLWAFPGEFGSSWSPLGTPRQPRLPHFLRKNPLPQGFPWGTRTARNTNYYEDFPITGVTRYYDWTVARQPCNPDGLYNNTCLLVNDQFPGPMIEANWGDWIEVKVTNDIPDEGTAIHWHGLLQKETPWMDGTPGVVQCPIAPGSTFTYRFRAELYGSTWWHSHWSAQYGSGLWGPLVIYGPLDVSYDDDMGPVMISDYFHEYYTTAVELTLAPPAQARPPLAMNNLINGKASTGTGPLASFNVTSGSTYRIRVINPSSASSQIFTIDGYELTVIANDFVTVEPYQTDHLTLAAGQRNDVLVKFDGEPTDSVWMRGYRPTNCGPSAANPGVKAAIFYQDADRSKEPTTQPGPNAYTTNCANDPLSQTIPVYPIDPGEPSVTEIIPIEFESNGTALLWYMANRTFRADYNDPILLEAKLGNLDFPYVRNVHNYGTNNSVRFVFENTGTQPHPMHLHGHNIFVLQTGSCTSNETIFGNQNGTTQSGKSETVVSSKRGLNVDYGSHEKRNMPYGNCWDGSIVNPSNPQRRDVQMLLPGQYIVVQWNQDNPGTWPFHCHIAWHLSAGFVWMVLEQPQAVQTEMEIPSVMAQTCRDWSAYTGDHVVDQIDDGL